MRIDIVTGLPDLFGNFLDQSIVGIARKKGLVTIEIHDLRDHGIGRQRQIDDYPFGGGSGMVLKPEPLFSCLESIGVGPASESPENEEVVYLTPDGEVFEQAAANRMSLRDRIVFIAGHYKGIDQRVRDHFVTKEVSLGDYVISGGELAAAVVVDAVTRLKPGVLGDSTSALTDSFQDGLLDAPVYTRPAEYRGSSVPQILLSGDHAKIAAWTEKQRMERTRKRRPDLLDHQD